MKKVALGAVAVLAMLLTGCVAHHSDVWGSWGLNNCTGPNCTITFNSDNTVDFFGVPTTYSWDSDDHIVINPKERGEAPMVYAPNLDGDELKLDGRYEQAGKVTNYFGFKVHRVIVTGQH